MIDIAPEPALAFVDRGDGQRIAIRHRPASAGQPAILFLPGYASDMAGQKAVAIDHYCAARGLGCIRLDYSGTGHSEGDFAAGTLARWLADALAVVDRVVHAGPLVVMGSSMGGWIALHVALRRPERVAAILGIAAAPDFTHWGYSPEEKAVLLRDGWLGRPNAYGPEPSIMHRPFWQSGEALRLLDAAIDLALPVRLIHGDQDTEVPLSIALKLIEQLRSADVQLRLIKGGGHRLSDPHEIHAILVELAGLVELIDR
ncbi:MAG: lysophospholipase [Pseudomonadota bacterium]|nr:lysophospholipase [Pseudomonadota bacterium]